MNKVKLSHQTWARVLAFILFVLAVPAAALSAVNILIAESRDWYSAQPTSFYESSFCTNLARNNAHEAAYYEYDRMSSEYAMDDYGRRPIDARYSNFLYVAKLKDGTVLGQNTDGEAAVLVLDSYSVGIYDDITIYVTAYVRAPLEVRDEFYWNSVAFDLLYGMRYKAIPIAGISFILAAALFVFLMRCAGRRAEHEGFVLAGADKIPLDVYTAVALTLGFMALVLAVETGAALPWALVYGGAGLMLATVFFGGFCMTLAARIKTRSLFRNVLVFRACGWCWRNLKRMFNAAVAVLPLLWKLILGLGAFLLINVIGVATFFGVPFLGLLVLLVFNGAVLYGLIRLSAQLIMLENGAKALAGGDLNYKLDTEKLLWDFKDHGMSLNRISEGLARAVEERTRSERFKTELITNVSHDIKTPLTSIVSYVDLLKREDIPNEKAREYIEVLDRQSARLKKLTEDLVEASKASAGTISLVSERVDVGELLRQAAGEYAQRLEQAGVSTVLNLPDEPLFVLADGRQMWRVFDNLISNICKYALAGTRAYFSAQGEHGQVEIVFRNISASQMNISADELMERFVRGDSSRSTEGSGLGLAIARSLTELMGGRFAIRLDGDLFKIVIGFRQVD